MNSQDPSSKKILLIQTAFIGDVILTTPLIRRCKEIYPRAIIDFLCIPVAKNLLETHPDLSRVLTYDKRKSHRPLRSFLSLSGLLRKNRYDMVISPHRSLRSSLLSFLSGAPVRITFSKSAGSKLLYTHRVVYDSTIHEVWRNLSLLSLPQKTPLTQQNAAHYKPEIFPASPDQKKVEEWLYEKKLKPHSFVCIAPGAVWATKRWSVEGFIALAKQILATGKEVVFIGGEPDKVLAEKIQAAAGGFNAAGLFSLRESYYLIAQSTALVSNDSAPLHMGSAAKVPTIAIFGATIPEFGFGPFGDHPFTILQNSHLSCRPCGIHGGNQCHLGTLECMQSIAAATVFQALTKIWRTS